MGHLTWLCLMCFNIYVRYIFILQSVLKSSYGIDSRLFQELMEQTSFCQRAAQCSINREAVLQEIKRYQYCHNVRQCVTYMKRSGVWIGNWIYWTYCLQHLTTICSVTPVLTLDISLHTHWVLLICCPSPVYRLPMVDIPFLGSRTIPMP
jgi:hypothetical protein